MKLTILGSGTVDPRGDRAASGYHLADADRQWVVDLGPGSLRNGDRFGLDMAGISTVFLTHYHPDHTADLVSFLFARKYAPGGWQKRRTLTVWGPPGLEELLAALYTAWPSIKPKDESTQVVTKVLSLEGGHCEFLPGLKVYWRAVEHGDMNALAFRFQGEERTIAFSGDTKLCQGVIDIARKADLFVCECSCFGRGCEPLGCREVHLSWEDVAEICQESKPLELVLTHLYEVVLDTPPGILEPLSQSLDIPVSLGYDGAIFQID